MNWGHSLDTPTHSLVCTFVYIYIYISTSDRLGHAVDMSKTCLVEKMKKIENKNIYSLPLETTFLHNEFRKKQKLWTCRN